MQIYITFQSLFERNRYSICVKVKYVTAKKRKTKQVESPKAQRCRRDVKPICLVLRVLIRNQFLAHARYRLRIFNDANLVAQHGTAGSRERVAYRAFAHLLTDTHARERDIFSLYLAFLLRQLIRAKFGLQIGEIEREIKQTRAAGAGRGATSSRALAPDWGWFLQYVVEYGTSPAAQCFRRTKARDKAGRAPIRGSRSRELPISACNERNPFKRDNRDRCRFRYDQRQEASSVSRSYCSQVGFIRRSHFFFSSPPSTSRFLSAEVGSRSAHRKPKLCTTT